MKCRRILCILVVLPMLSESVLGSDPGKALQVRESDLGDLIQGKRGALQLVEGARVEGRVRKVTDTSLLFKVKKSSDLAAYPKGEMQIPRAAVSRIEIRDLNKILAVKRAKQTALTFGVALGTFLLGATLIMAATSREAVYPAMGVGIATGATVAVAMNRPRRSKDVTLIEIVPDSTGEGAPKPATKDTSLNTTIPAGTAPLFFETSSPGPLRHQVLRALMRQGQDRPFRLSDQGSAAK